MAKATSKVKRQTTNQKKSVCDQYQKKLISLIKKKDYK